MSTEASRTWGEQVFKALKAKSANKSGNDESPVVRGKIHSKINGGFSTDVDAMDSGCTHPLTTMSVTQAIQGVGHCGGFRKKLEDSGYSEDVSGSRCSGRKEDDRSTGHSRRRHEGSPGVLGPDEELGFNSSNFSCRNSFRLFV